MSSPDHAPGPAEAGGGPAQAAAEGPDKLPPALSSMWRLFRLGMH